MEMKKELIKNLYDGVELDINKRWMSGTPHHHRSLELFKKLETLDFHFQNDYFGFKSGGDGDNGEQLMYLMDIIFEKEDLENKV